MDEYTNDIDTDNLTKYKEIMENYRNGEYGCEHLTLDEILSIAGEPDLLRQLNLEELDELINNTFGMHKEVFVMLKNELTDKTKNGVGLVKTMNTNNPQHN